MTRLEANKELARLIAEFSEKNPTLRFSQILIAFGFCDTDGKVSFYKEPEEVLKDVLAKAHLTEGDDQAVS